MTDEKKPGIFAKLFGKGDNKKKKSCCCCGDFEIEEIKDPNNSTGENSNFAL